MTTQSSIKRFMLGIKTTGTTRFQNVVERMREGKLEHADLFSTIPPEWGNLPEMDRFITKTGAARRIVDAMKTASEQKQQMYPAACSVFRALREIGPSQVRAIVIGNGCARNPSNQAGLPFSCSSGIEPGPGAPWIEEDTRSVNPAFTFRGGGARSIAMMASPNS